MIRLAIVVEGHTERQFVRRLLVGHLVRHSVLAEPILISPGGQSGGDVTVERLTLRMAQLSYQFDAITTLVDFYGFRQRPTDDAAELERRIDEAYAHSPHRQLRGDQVFAYVQRHEFEALLFSNVRAFERTLGASLQAVTALSSARMQFATPEDINDSPDTAPSKRITRAIPRYRKVVDGTQVAAAIGLETMRRECPRFSAWISRLESLDADD